jgi:pimeloyl-ACP methyl ester carboxylesterase
MLTAVRATAHRGEAITDQELRFDYRAEMSACARAIGIRPREIVLPEDRWVELNGIRWHYLDWGNPHLPHLVLLHGGGLTAHTWDMAALLLRDRYHIVAPDQRGHGDTGATPEHELDGDNNDLMLRDTEAFIEHLGYDRLVLCGMSMGALNTIRYAALHPKRLEAVVIVDVGPAVMLEGRVEMEQFRNETETLRNFGDFLERAIRFNPERRPEHLRYSLLHSLKRTAGGWTWKQHVRPNTPRESAKERWQAEREERARWMRDDLSAIKLPTLLLRGARSKMLSPEAAIEAASFVDDCELAVIPDAGHSVQGDNPQEFARVLDDFLTRRLEWAEAARPAGDSFATTTE